MTTNFIAVCATTVPKTYSWDIGTPLETASTLTTAYNTTEYVSGYAPGVNVVFTNTSISDENYPFINYDWDFGDLYHDINNTATLSCASTIEHLYIMPGIYTVTLTHQQSRTRTFLETDPLLCRGKFNVRWFWSNLECNRETFKTWDETMCVQLTAPTFEPGSVAVPGQRWTPKWWDDEGKCFGKHCVFWSWYELTPAPGRTNPIKWVETKNRRRYNKKWMYQDNETQCNNREFTYQDTLDVLTKITTKTIVEVKEIPPTAGITCLTRPLTGTSPYTAVLSPTACIPGSFPIDRIDWDLGDGTPIKTILRYANIIDPEIIYTNTFSDDLLDVRNYNIRHTYTRCSNTCAVFYPSLTCYSANTSTFDSCCTTVGPILLPPASELTILKVRNTLKGNVYAIDTENKIAFLSDSISGKNITNIKTNKPLTTLKDSSNKILLYFGNPGNNYPPVYTVDCRGVINLPSTYISTEDSTPLIVTDELEDTGVPILTEEEIIFIP